MYFMSMIKVNNTPGMSHSLSADYLKKIEDQQTQAATSEDKGSSILDETQISKSPGISDSLSIGT
jgi:hypothetical protein